MTGFDRRSVLRTLAQFAMIAVPIGRGRLAAADRVEIQPLLAQARRVIDAMRHLGVPFGESELASLSAAETAGSEPAILAALERLLATRCLADIRINPEGRISIEPGPAAARLVEQGWRAFLVKVRNEAGLTGRLAAESPHAP